MKYEYLARLFGTPKDGEQPKALTYEELEAAIEADKGISLANLKDGGYIAREKYDAKDTELRGVQKQLEAANSTIKTFEGQDVESIRKSVSDWETKYNTDTKQLRDQLAAQARSHAEEMFLSGYHFTSKAARNGVLAELRSKQFQIEDGVILGGKEFMQSLMENDDYKGAFVAPKPDSTGNGDGNHGENGGGGQRKPTFTTGTNGGVASTGDAPKFNFGFTRIREPESK